jgi:Na+-translocating ferredoxin:NAD+ oxidoreductase RnfG subunit
MPVQGGTPRPAEKRATSGMEIGDVHVYLTPDQAVREIFDEVASVDTLHAALTADEVRQLELRLGSRAPSDSVTILRPRSRDGAALGYAILAEEIGKYRPITFLVGTDPDRHVKGVEVLVYRESRGGEVRRERFLRQYRDKSAADPLRASRDILNVAGATLSVNAMNRGVKRALLTLDILAARGIL